jgi:hypothetical protein
MVGVVRSWEGAVVVDEVGIAAAPSEIITTAA